jgi:hypothetical protein
MTSKLWYPGRVPMCTDEVIWLFSRLAETLHQLAKTRDGTLLGVVDTIVEDAQAHLLRESVDCLHTDETIKNLLEFCKTVLEASHALYNNRSWRGITNLTVTTVALRDELKDALAQVTEDVAVKAQ